jgi:hypothetical protein
MVSCSTCGALIPDTALENVDHPENQLDGKNAADLGHGTCRRCGGTAETVVDAGFRRRMGDNYVAFMDARIETLPRWLSPENAIKFRDMGFPQKCLVIQRLIEKGAMI